MAAIPYPHDIKPLTSLRFIAAFWVLLYHFKDHLSLGLGRNGLIADGYLGVDLFFILSGFILAHVYLAAVQAREFGYGGFLKNRIARVYPMHLAALAAMLVLYMGAAAIGAGVGSPSAFKLSDLPAHVFMVHAWGATEAVGWNFPSWSISAEWAAYLLFPIVAALVLKTKCAGWVLAGALALCLASFAALSDLHQVLPWVGRDFSQMTAQIGALRIMPSFLLGVALYNFGRTHDARAEHAWPIVLVSAFWIVAVCTLRLWEGLIWFGLTGLIYGLAETARHGRDAVFASKGFVFLGASSYALYMIHLPVDIVWFHALEKVGITEAAPLVLRLAALAGVFAACIAAAALAYVWIEVPARNWLRKLDLRALTPNPARRPSAAR